MDVECLSLEKLLNLNRLNAYQARFHSLNQILISAKETFGDFDIVYAGSLNILEETRQVCPGAIFIFISTNKVHGGTLTGPHDVIKNYCKSPLPKKIYEIFTPGSSYFYSCCILRSLSSVMANMV